MSLLPPDLSLTDLLATATPEVDEAPTFDSHTDLPSMPCPTALIDPAQSTEQQITTLVEADALLAATINVRLGQKLAEMAELSDDIEAVRKTYQTFGARADLVEKRKAPAQNQVPLTIVFERAAPLPPGVTIDVRSGAEMAKLRAAAAGAETVTVKPTPQAA